MPALTASVTDLAYGAIGSSVVMNSNNHSLRDAINNHATLIDGYVLGTAFDASVIASGIIPPARLGTGSGGSSKYLREDSTWQLVAAASSDNIDPKTYGAIGDGASHPLSSVYATLAAAQVVYPFATALTQELDYCAFQKASYIAFGASGAENGYNNAILNKPFLIQPGSYQFGNDTWVIKNASGVYIRGAGRTASKIQSNAITLQFDGLWYSRIEGLDISCTGAGICALDLDGNVPGHAYATRGVQGNTFKDVIFQAGPTSLYALAVCRQGSSGGQGSENLFLDCHFFGNGTGQTALYYQTGFNALQNTFIGGNFQFYGKNGIQCDFGSVIVNSVGFQAVTGYTQIANDGYDIDCSAGGSYTPISVYSCRTESARFFRGNSAQPGVLKGNSSFAGFCTDWFATTAYTLDQMVQKVAPSGSRVFYRVTTAGTSGGAEPAWPESGIVADGTVVWTQLRVDVVTQPSGVLDVDQSNTWYAGNIFIPEVAGHPTKRITASYTAKLDDEFILCDTTAGNINVTLPVFGADYPVRTRFGKKFTIKKVTTDANTITLLTDDGFVNGDVVTAVIPGGSRGFIQVEKATGANGTNAVYWITAKSTDAAGANTQIQFNDAGSFNGNANFLFYKATGYLQLGTVAATNLLHISGPLGAGLVLHSTGAASYGRNGYTLQAGINGVNNEGFSIKENYTNQTRFFIDDFGQVAIGSTATDSTVKLAVNGNFLAFGNIGFGATATSPIRTGLAENASGVVEINNGTLGTLRDLTLRSLLPVGGTVTVDTPIVAGTQTWNAAGISFHGVKYNFTNTASAAGARTFALQLAGVDKFAVDINGVVQAGTWQGTAINATYIGTHVHSAADITTGILATARGGTGSAFFSIAGPTVARVYTFPDAAATIMYNTLAAGGDLAGTYPSPTIKASVSLTTPVIGVATGTSLAVTGALTSSGGGIGYATGAGGTVTQATSRVTGVTLNKLSGTITLFSTTLAADTDVTFTLTDSFIAVGDILITNIVGGAAIKGGYSVNAIAAAGSATITVHNHTPTITATEAPVIAFAIIKAVTA